MWAVWARQAPVCTVHSCSILVCVHGVNSYVEESFCTHSQSDPSFVTHTGRRSILEERKRKKKEDAEKDIKKKEEENNDKKVDRKASFRPQVTRFIFLFDWVLLIG